MTAAAAASISIYLLARSYLSARFFYNSTEPLLQLNEANNALDHGYFLASPRHSWDG